ncbi:MAG: hypothetical protein ACE3JQ_09825 [Paenisporosarcina sp.]
MTLLRAFFIKLKLGRSLVYILLIIFGLTSCSNENNLQESFHTAGIGNPIPADFLDDEKADIFVLEDIVYSNAQDIEWVEELTYTLGEKVGEIIEITGESKKFGNGTSNKLPIGTKIYQTDTAVYIAIVEGEEIPYIKMIEG